MRSSAQAVAAALATTRNRHGWCLWHVQDWFAAPHIFPGARQQWEGARDRHPGDPNPPPGVPVYFDTSSKWNHIAISLGQGMCRSTDAAGATYVANRPLGWFTRWGGRGYLGWSGDIGGLPIPDLSTPATPEPEPEPEPERDPDMRIIRRTSDGSVAKVTADLFQPVSSLDEYNALTGVFGPAVEVTDFMWNLLKGSAERARS